MHIIILKMMRKFNDSVNSNTKVDELDNIIHGRAATIEYVPQQITVLSSLPSDT